MNKIKSVPCRIHFSSLGANININSEYCFGRIEQILKLRAYDVLYSAVHRTEILRKAFEFPYKINNDSLSLFDLNILFTSIIGGKHIILPVFYFAKNYFCDKDARPNIYKPLNEVISTPSNAQLITAFINFWHRFIYEKEKIPLEIAQNKLTQTLQSITPYRLFNRDSFLTHSLFSYPLRTLYIQKASKYIPFLSFIKKTYTEFIWEMRKTIYNYKLSNQYKLTKNMKGFPYYDKEARKEWNEIIYYIKKHNLSIE